MPDTAVITCLCDVPPAVNGEFSNAAYLNARVIVPKGTLASYQSADVWKNFWDIQEGEATGISKISTEQPKASVIYDLQGRKLREPQKGVNIINGKKIFVK